MHALVVDDNALLRRTLKRLMELNGFDGVAEADNGRSALAAVQSSHPDLIVTDCQMPEMDGLAFVRALRAQGDATPVIMVSALADPQLGEAALAAGANTYVPKPVEPEVLFARIHEMLAARPAA